MSYDVNLRAKVEGVDKYVQITDDINITYNVRKLIEASSGWDIINCDNNGKVEDLVGKIKNGIDNLRNEPDKYRHLEDSNGWGTVEQVLRFYTALFNDCQEHPYGYVFVD